MRKIPVTNLTEDKFLIERMNTRVNSGKEKENITESPNNCESGHASAYTENNDDEISALYDKCLKNNMMMGGRDKIRRAVQKYIKEIQQPNEFSPTIKCYHREDIDRYLYAIREVFPDTMEFIGVLHYIGESLKDDGLIGEYTVSTLFKDSDYVSFTFTGSDFTFKNIIGKTIDHLTIKNTNSVEKRRALENAKKTIVKNWSYYKIADNSDEVRAITKVIKSYLNSVMDLVMNKEELINFEDEMCEELKELDYINSFVLKATLQNVSLQVEQYDGHLLFFDIPFPHEMPITKDNAVSHEDACSDDQAGTTNPETAINTEAIENPIIEENGNNEDNNQMNYIRCKILPSLLKDKITPDVKEFVRRCNDLLVKSKQASSVCHKSVGNTNTVTVYPIKKEIENNQGLNEYSGNSANSSVNHPSHYNQYDMETIDMMEKIWGPEAVRMWCIMTAFKYRMRMGHKTDNPINQDFDKEQWYLNKADDLSTKIENENSRN